MGLFSSFFSADGGLHQVTRNGDIVTDLTTGQSGFVVSASPGFETIADSRGRLHQVIKNGNVSTDLTTGTSWFEI